MVISCYYRSFMLYSFSQPKIKKFDLQDWKSLTGQPPQMMLLPHHEGQKQALKMTEFKYTKEI